MWQPMTGDLQRFNGAMARQASTWKGLTSTLSDAIKLTSARVFQPLFDVAKSAVGNLNDVLSGDAFSAWADSAGESISDFVQRVGGHVGNFITAVQAVGVAFPGEPGA